jgi:hypothetical protein
MLAVIDARTKMQEDNATRAPLVGKKGAVFALLGAIAIGVIGSGLWDMLAKPGLGRLGRLFLTLVTLGSESARSQAYADAALDPTPLPSLILLLFLYALPFLVLLGDVTAKGTRFLFGTKLKELRPGGYRVISITILAMFLLAASWGFVKFLTVNQSVLIYRVFNANMRICAPYLSDSEERKFKARFAAVKTRSDYLAIEEDLKKLAVSKSIGLVNQNKSGLLPTEWVESASNVL